MHKDANKRTELGQMKFVATALLGVVTVIYVAATLFEGQSLWVGFVAATAEAAMVGAIADWFAVTALFRHPLNLKVPHTAIIPRRKDSIAEHFGNFVQRNFLTEQVISDKLHSMNLAEKIARWMSQPENSAIIANQVTIGLAGIMQIMSDEDIQEMIERSVQSQIRSTRIAPILGNLLSLVISGQRKQELFEGTVQFGAHILEENKDVIQEKIAEETPKWFPEAVDKAIYKKVVDVTEKTLREIDSNPDHPFRQRFDSVLDKFLDDLKHSPEIQAKEEALKEELLQQPVVQDFASTLWVDIKRSVLEHSTDPNAEFRAAVQHGITQFGKTLLKDSVLLAKTNRWLEAGAIFLTQEYGHEAAHLISETVKKWDAQSASDKIELEIGKDLQFIRINGTIVGGLAGLLIHSVSVFL